MAVAWEASLVKVKEDSLNSFGAVSTLPPGCRRLSPSKSLHFLQTVLHPVSLIQALRYLCLHYLDCFPLAEGIVLWLPRHLISSWPFAQSVNARRTRVSVCEMINIGPSQIAMAAPTIEEPSRLSSAGSSITKVADTREV
jgi:hypothetical protein